MRQRAHDRKTRDFNKVKCVKDEMEQLLRKEKEIRHRWQEYFDKLFNGENENTTVQLDDSFDGALCRGFKNQRSEKP